MTIVDGRRSFTILERKIEIDPGYSDRLLQGSLEEGLREDNARLLKDDYQLHNHTEVIRAKVCIVI